MGVYDSIAKNKRQRTDRLYDSLAARSTVYNPDPSAQRSENLLLRASFNPQFIKYIMENNPEVERQISQDYQRILDATKSTSLATLSDLHLYHGDNTALQVGQSFVEGIFHPGFGSEQEYLDTVLPPLFEENEQENINQIQYIVEESIDALVGNATDIAQVLTSDGIEKFLVEDLEKKLATAGASRRLIDSTLDATRLALNDLDSQIALTRQAMEIFDEIQLDVPGQSTIPYGRVRTYDEYLQARDFLATSENTIDSLSADSARQTQLLREFEETVKALEGKTSNYKNVVAIASFIGKVIIVKDVTAGILTFGTKNTQYDVIEELIKQRKVEIEKLIESGATQEEIYSLTVTLIHLVLVKEKLFNYSSLSSEQKDLGALGLADLISPAIVGGLTAIGAFVGSAVPGVGTALGAGAGGAIGSGIALFAGFFGDSTHQVFDSGYRRIFGSQEASLSDLTDSYDIFYRLVELFGNQEAASIYLLETLKAGSGQSIMIRYVNPETGYSITELTVRPRPAVIDKINSGKYIQQDSDSSEALGIINTPIPTTILYFEPEFGSFIETSEQTANLVVANTNTFSSIDGETFEYIITVLDSTGITGAESSVISEYLSDTLSSVENTFEKYILSGGETVELTRNMGDMPAGTYVYNDNNRQWCLIGNAATNTRCFPENVLYIVGARPTIETVLQVEVAGLVDPFESGSNNSDAADTPGETGGGTGGDADTAPDATGVETLTLALDSDQCKISRLYEPLEQHFKTLSVGASSTELFLCGKHLKLANTNASYVPNKSDTANKFYVDPDTFSGLVPDYQLFKVYRQFSTGNNQIGDITAIHQIKFPKTITNARDVSADIDQIGANSTDEQKKAIFSNIANEMKLDNIGVKSIDWHYEGTDRFTADKVISAQVVLFMENFDALFVERTALNADGTEAYKYKISDLLIHPECVKGSRPIRTNSDAQQTVYSSQERNVYNPGCYEILLKAGYLDNPGMYSSLYLSLIGHQFSFQENGSVEVTINYRGRIEAVLRSATADIKLDNSGIIPETLAASLDLLTTQETRGVLTPYTETKEVLETVPNPTITAANSPGSAMSTRVAAQGAQDQTVSRGLVTETKYKFKRDSSVSAVVKTLEDAKTKLEAKGTKTDADNKDLQIIKGVLAQVDKEVVLQFFGRVSKVLIDKNRVFNLNVKNSNELKAYLQTPNISTLKALIDFIGLTNVLSAEKLAEQLNNPFGQSNPEQPESPSQPAASPSGQTVSVDTQGIESDTTDSGGAEEADPAAPPEVSAEKNIPYVYFGHLIDAIIYVCQARDTSDESDILDDVMVVLPNIMMPSKSSNFADLKPISMAGIPVAITTIMNFANIRAESGQKSFTFYALLRDLINEVLIESLGVQCPERRFMPVYKPNILQYTRFNKTINSYLDSNALQATNGSTEPGGYFGLKDFIDSSREIIFTDLGGSGRQVNSVTAFVPSIEIENYNEISSGNKESDKTKGIPHFTFGSNNNGLFIKCDLQKVDQPYLVESRFTDTNGSILTQFSNIYNASLEMIGNDLFTLGDYVFLNFQTMANSLGSPNTQDSLSYFMGLGGLHLITDIKTTMTPGNYKTVVQARYVGRGGKAQGAQS